jgi:hypothetical protein
MAKQLSFGINEFRKEFDRITSDVPKPYWNWCRFGTAVLKRGQGYIGMLEMWSPDGERSICHLHFKTWGEALGLVDTFYFGIPGVLGENFRTKKEVAHG